LKQAAASALEDLAGLEDELQSCQADLAKHREEANECISHLLCNSYEDMYHTVEENS